MSEVTPVYGIEATLEWPELQVVPKVTIACKTDLGLVRENNEDKFEYFLPEDSARLAARGLLFVVCDGMGGHEAGQIASELASKRFIEGYMSNASPSAAVALRDAVRSANRIVHDVATAIPSRRGMGTTLSALALVQRSAWVAQVGDSRVYRLREGELEALTTDHTWVQETVDSGAMTQEEAEAHPYRHMLTRAIGTDRNVEPDVFEFDLLPGDVFLLCSDGLTNHVPENVIAERLGLEGVSDACASLIQQALAGGGSDNATALVVRVDSLESIAGDA
ncbi:MAG: Stp1/IreP family PP2C-type Ser/Thr phosphatase [Armatimonadetes bacterium]|nr:MAG: Stp1/IreP family PP2C-type Ser/Thr phosphatase [Armatimonadota bacterium]